MKLWMVVGPATAWVAITASEGICFVVLLAVCVARSFVGWLSSLVRFGCLFVVLFALFARSLVSVVRSVVRLSAHSLSFARSFVLSFCSLCFVSVRSLVRFGGLFLCSSVCFARLFLRGFGAIK